MPQISINSLLGHSGPNYPEAIVKPYREELQMAGFEALLSAAAVDQALGRSDNQVTLLVLNSVCGCSARVARPGTILSLLHDVLPDHRVTIFAGMEKEAVAHLREKYLPGLTPSSPNIALFRNGQLLHIIHRHQIEGRTAADIAAELTAVYQQVCSKQASAQEHQLIRECFQALYQADSNYLVQE